MSSRTRAGGRAGSGAEQSGVGIHSIPLKVGYSNSNSNSDSNLSRTEGELETITAPADVSICTPDRRTLRPVGSADKLTAAPIGHCVILIPSRAGPMAAGDRRGYRSYSLANKWIELRNRPTARGYRRALNMSFECSIVLGAGHCHCVVCAGHCVGRLFEYGSNSDPNLNPNPNPIQMTLRLGPPDRTGQVGMALVAPK